MPGEKKNPVLTMYRWTAMTVFFMIVALCLFAVFGGRDGDDGHDAAHDGMWTCSMCPQFILPDPGKCPKCFMDLIPLEGNALGGGKRELVIPYAAADSAGISAAVAEAADAGEAEGKSGVPGEEAGEPAVTIPASAVLENMGRRFVFTESDDGENLTFTLREIEVTGRSGVNVLVRSGLDEGDVVVESGAFRIDSALQILGKVSLVNLPDGELSAVDEDGALEPYRPAERSGRDLRAEGVGLDEWFQEYEGVRAALAKDDVEAVGQPAARLKRLLGAVNSDGDGELGEAWKRLEEEAGALAEAGTLEGGRDAFEKITGEMVFLARRFGAPEGGLNLVFCPMAFGGEGAYWLQPQETVDNPYHGLEMPLCGWMVDTLKGDL